MMGEDSGAVVAIVEDRDISWTNDPDLVASIDTRFRTQSYYTSALYWAMILTLTIGYGDIRARKLGQTNDVLHAFLPRLFRDLLRVSKILVLGRE